MKNGPTTKTNQARTTHKIQSAHNTLLATKTINNTALKTNKKGMGIHTLEQTIAHHWEGTWKEQ